MKYSFFIFFLLLSFVRLYGQGNELPSFNSIRTPTSPAFTILGVQPSAVERPNSPADLALSLYEATSGLTTLPQNFSAEGTPYWWKNRSLSWQEDVDRDLLQSLSRTFSFSLASNQSEVAEIKATGLAGGVRVMLFSGKTSAKSQSRIRSIQEQLAADAERFYELNSSIDSALTRNLQRTLQGCDGDTACISSAINAYRLEKAQIDSLKTIAYAKITNDAEAKDELQVFSPQREGFMLEVAAAGALHAMDNSWDNLQFSKSGFWLTPAYIKNRWSFIGVGRYLSDSSKISSFEYGARILYSKSAFAVSAEYLGGNYLDDQSDNNLEDRFRLAAIVEYRLQKNVWLNFTFGKDNNGIRDGAGIVSLLGINFNISKDRYDFEQ